MATRSIWGPSVTGSVRDRAQIAVWQGSRPDCRVARIAPRPPGRQVRRAPGRTAASAALVVRGLVGDRDVVGVALLAAGGGDPHEPGPPAQRVERRRPGV